MPSDKGETGTDEDDYEERLRKGRPVIKTTIEMDRDLYYRVKEEVVRKRTSLRDFMSTAAYEKLARGDIPAERRDLGLGDITDIVERNRFVNRVLAVLEGELPYPFNLTILVSKAEKHNILLEEMAPSHLTDALIDDIVLPIDLVSGPLVANNIRKALIGMRGG